jgi:hypothetical protein
LPFLATDGAWICQLLDQGDRKGESLKLFNVVQAVKSDFPVSNNVPDTLRQGMAMQVENRLRKYFRGHFVEVVTSPENFNSIYRAAFKPRFKSPNKKPRFSL